MNPYPRRLFVTTTYNAKQLVWYALSDDHPDIIGNGRTEAGAAENLYEQIAEREADDNDEDRWEYETGAQS